MRCQAIIEKLNHTQHDGSTPSKHVTLVHGILTPNDIATLNVMFNQESIIKVGAAGWVVLRGWWVLVGGPNVRLCCTRSSHFCPQYLHPLPARTPRAGSALPNLSS